MKSSKLSLTKVGLNFHHIGLAVSDPKPSQQFLRTMGYKISREVFDPLQNTKLILCSHTGLPDMELVYSSANKKPSPLTSILENADQSFYHICYSTKDLRNSLNVLNKNKVRAICVSHPKPAVLFGGKKVSFYFIKGFGLMEILEDSHE